MATTLVLVRHCASRVDAATPPSTWGLSDVGREQARVLASWPDFNDLVAVACGTEPKMAETVTPLGEARGLPIEQNVSFAESHSEGWLEADHFSETVNAFFGEPLRPPAPGWEPADAAAGRFLAAARERLTRQPAGGVAVCSGGRVLTAVLVRLGLVPPADAFDVWRGIQMPDVAVVAFAPDGATQLRRPFGPNLRQ